MNTSPALEALKCASRNTPFVIAQLGQSLDGRIATVSGESRWINGTTALDHIHHIRANVDAVVVGVDTVLKDDPLLTVRRITGKNPVRVVIDPNNRLPQHARCFHQDDSSCIVIRGVRTHDKVGVTAHEKYNELFVLTKSRFLSPHEIIRQLFALGLRRIFVEGGARTISKFIDADAVDRLHLLVAPIIIGSGKTGLQLKPIKTLKSARRPATSTYYLGNGEILYDCDLRIMI
ncbi:MAG: hypothetical protein TECD_00807 [Hyphomicrobiaceae bacterium hypho_1]